MSTQATTAEENQSVTTSSPRQPGALDETNPDQSIEPTQDNTETRTQLVSLYARGATTDARALYAAFPGATEPGWTALERMLSPVKSFVLDGLPPYAQPLNWTGEYSGIANQIQESQDAVEAEQNREVTLQTTTGHEVQAVQQGQGGETEPLPGAQRTASSATVDGETQSEAQMTASGLVAAGDLVERARTANSREELDEIEGLAEGRSTVLNAVEARRNELNLN